MNQIPFSKDFVEKFKAVIREYLYYDKYGEFYIVPSILQFTSVVSYIPVLSYSEIKYEQKDKFIKDAKDFDYLIKVLNPQYSQFKKNDTVTLRLDISSNNYEEILEHKITSRCRNKIKKAYKEEFEIKKGNRYELLIDFYSLYSRTMYEHGSPAHSIELFRYLHKHMKKNVEFLIYYKSGKPIYAICVLYDNDIAWYGWGGRDKKYSSVGAGYVVFSEAIKEASQMRKKTIFDFGRSAYESGGYDFKVQFGASPVKIDILSKEKKGNIYSKYKLASTIWKLIPYPIANKLGAFLIRYLPDY